MNYAQMFCTVADLIADAQAPGVDDARMFQAVREASDYIQKKIGWFIPVTLTRKFNGLGSSILFVPPLLAITSILNDDISLTSAAYLLKPDDGFWPNGPYAQLIVAPNNSELRSWSSYDDGVEIAGRWGKYERSGLTGATVQDDPQDNSQLTLKVNDGSKVSPGMVLTIGTEQELMSGWDSPTLAVTTLNGAVTAGDDVVTLADGALVNIGELLRVEFEQMLARDKQGNLCSVARGWNGTKRVAHLTGTTVDVYRTAKVERAVNGTTAAEHAKNVAISRYFAPDDIQYLTKQIATLIVNKAKSGYQGRTGNQELGVVFYNDAFPKMEIEQLKANYYIPRGG